MRDLKRQPQPPERRAAFNAFEIDFPFAIEFIDPATGAPIPTAPISQAAGLEGVLVLTAGTDYNVLRFLPSLAITDDQLRDAIEVIGRAIASTKPAA